MKTVKRLGPAPVDGLRRSATLPECEVVGDFSLEEYLALHRVVHRVARALEATVATERVYILSLGSQQGNAHVHWHVAALPPGVPYHEQQFRALMAETKGVLALTAEEQADLADQLRAAMDDAV